MILDREMEHGVWLHTRAHVKAQYPDRVYMTICINPLGCDGWSRELYLGAIRAE
jgi:hypothetical protein